MMSKELAWQVEARQEGNKKPRKKPTLNLSISNSQTASRSTPLPPVPVVKAGMNDDSSIPPTKPFARPSTSASACRMAIRRKALRNMQKDANLDSPAWKKPKCGSAELPRLIAEAQWAGARLDVDSQTRNTRSSLKAGVSPTASVPATVTSTKTTKKKPQDAPRRKRKHGDTECATVPLVIKLPPARKEEREIASLPKKRSQRPSRNPTPAVSAPSVPKDTLGDSASTIHAIIRDSATSAISLLRCNDPVVEEWETEDPPVDPPSAVLGPGHEDSPSNYVLGPIMEEAEERLSFPKLPLPDYPPIWSQASLTSSRQEVCETFPRFRSYQGGVYFRKDIVEGYLLGGFSARRDIFHNGGKLIISHGGGKAESIRKTDGHFHTYEASDQLRDDKSVRALMNTYHQRLPVALLIDDKYTLFPFDLASKGCAYAVLGWYYISHAWAEYQSATNSQGRVVRYKFAFQWADGQQEPWWSTWPTLADPEPASSEEVSATNGLSIGPKKCQTCKKLSSHVYEQGWMCLKPECKRFWTFQDGAGVSGGLTYTKSFLQPVSGFKMPLMDIRPPLPVQGEEITGPTTSWHFSKGWHCTKCGRLSSRYKWEHWECRNCGERYSVPATFWKSSAFRFQTQASSKGSGRFGPLPGSGIILARPENFQCEKGIGEHYTYILPFGRGKIHVLSPHALSSKRADDVFQEYQEQSVAGELKFRRWPLRAHKCRGTLLTNYFSQNTGEPYQYVGGTDNTVSWESAPSAVVHALDLIKLRMKQAGLNCRSDFNEVLSAAYMEKQKMAFHSDAEKGLGPNVASLSLGASAEMYFRLHPKFAGELPPGSSRDVLKLYLRHGNVLVMEGADVQNFYEHTVVPANFRIAATARYIGDGHR
ncbi:hypothetical protein BC629DRAFT_1703523 [Irpex lacteus]|nr:hypothetical protein BC629DRAFT_1703523 [Irpex lacteus]